jgi:hypothetical protein
MTQAIGSRQRTRHRRPHSQRVHSSRKPPKISLNGSWSTSWRTDDLKSTSEARTEDTSQHRLALGYSSLLVQHRRYVSVQNTSCAELPSVLL